MIKGRRLKADSQGRSSVMLRQSLGMITSLAIFTFPSCMRSAAE
uniref:Uncharacterized protein n=1 Tax=virus sp. ct1Uu26 TaxID=2826789 RepID=A0A8S5R8S7_9VIRU|nr:MAG TPA: hypothetical protein [virus sp. ct1Uu26]